MNNSVSAASIPRFIIFSNTSVYAFQVTKNANTALTNPLMKNALMICFITFVYFELYREAKGLAVSQSRLSAELDALPIL